MSQENNSPVHRIRLSTIAAAIFKNTSQEGITSYSAVIDRSYKDGEEWKHTKNYNRDDLLYVSKVSDLANSWILQQEQADRSQKTTGPEPS
jgi:hypothetical protein